MNRQQAMQPLPGPDPVRALIGSSFLDARPDAAGIGELIGCAARAARAVTGGAGFDRAGTEVDPEIAEILVRSVARSLLNPELSLAESEPPFTGRPGSFPSWSDADFVVLQGYRDRLRDRGRAR